LTGVGMMFQVRRFHFRYHCESVKLFCAHPVQLLINVSNVYCSHSRRAFHSAKFRQIFNVCTSNSTLRKYLHFIYFGIKILTTSILNYRILNKCNWNFFI